MTPMTTTMKALSASARSTPAAPAQRTAARRPGRRSRPRGPAPTPLVATASPAGRRVSPAGDDHAAAEQGEDEDEHEDHQSCSSWSSSRSRSPNSDRRRWASTMSTTTPSRTSSETPSSIRNGTPAVHEERHQRDAVVDEEQPDDLKDRPAAGDQDEEAEQQGGHTHWHERAGGACPRRRATPRVAAKARTMRAAETTREAGTLTSGRRSRSRAPLPAALAEQDRDDHALERRARRPPWRSSRRRATWTPRVSATPPRATPWTATTRTTERAPSSATRRRPRRPAPRRPPG